MKVKVCGITRLQDAELAVELGAWAVGFLFYRESPRYLPPKEAREIVARLPDGIRKVGVFVNATPEEIAKAVAESGIDCVQLHGDESPDLARLIPGEVIKALRLRTDLDLEHVPAYRDVAAILVDAYSGKARGGTGETADWALAARAGRLAPVILAGGLTFDNVARAIVEVRPIALDVSSGVEASPGIKCPRKLRRFFQSVREVA